MQPRASTDDPAGGEQGRICDLRFRSGSSPEPGRTPERERTRNGLISEMEPRALR